MTIINRELIKLNIIIGIILTPIVIVIALSAGDVYYLGFLLVLAIVTKTSGVQFDAKNNGWNTKKKRATNNLQFRKQYGANTIK